MIVTSLHSSRMRTAHALKVTPSMLCARGGLLFWGGVCSWRGLLPGGVPAPGEVSAPGGCGIPACTEASPPPRGQNRRHL